LSDSSLKIQLFAYGSFPGNDSAALHHPDSAVLMAARFAPRRVAFADQGIDFLSLSMAICARATAAVRL
jgi:hypothetical protein